MRVEDVSTDSPHLGATNENGQLTFFVLFLVMMLFFFVVAAFIEKYKPKYGHETGYTILFGISLSLILYASLGDSATGFQFKSNFFFNFFLPPIIFNSGFTMYKKTFFKNLGNVAVFGLVVTLVCFVIYSLFGWLLLQKIGVQMNNPYCENHNIVPCVINGVEYANPQPITIPTMQILLFTALLCSSDVVAAVSIVDYTQQPKLYSCIFGEGVFNDIVSIILFNTVI